MRPRLRRLLGGRDAGGPHGVPEPTLVAPEDADTVARALPHTMTGVARLQTLADAVRHLTHTRTPGAFVECGVWRGGSVLAMALTLLDLGDTDRDLVLFDTFAGMTAPTEHDVSALEPPALVTWEEARRRGDTPWPELFAGAGLDADAVRALLLDTGYPGGRVHLVEGRVEDTLPGGAPEEIALLRLDTDWYESTAHELEHLYPRLARGGVLIVDDYGHWQGARRAVDEYFEREGSRPLLHRIDYTGRIAVKP